MLIIKPAKFQWLVSHYVSPSHRWSHCNQSFFLPVYWQITHIFKVSIMHSRCKVIENCNTQIQIRSDGYLQTAKILTQTKINFYEANFWRVLSWPWSSIGRFWGYSVPSKFKLQRMDIRKRFDFKFSSLHKETNHIYKVP